MKKILITIIAGSCFLSMQSCKKWIDDSFANPNGQTVAEPSTVLSSIHANMARGIQFDSRYIGGYTQYFLSTSALSTTERMGYFAGSDAIGEKWRTHYWNLGQNLLNIVRESDQSKRYEYAGACYAIWAWSWLHLTDAHGEVVLKQFADPNRITFDYDSQEEVYQHVMKIADSAVYFLNLASADAGASARLAVGDKYFYGGNINLYKKMAYGIKAKAFHRYSNKSTYKPDSVIKYVDLSFASAAEDAEIKFAGGISDASNFFGPRRANVASFRLSDWMVKMMNGTIFTGATDPRLGYITLKNTSNSYSGLLPGVGGTSTLTANFWGKYNASTISGGIDTDARTFFKNESNFPVLTYTDLQFMKAEAAFKKGDKNLALTAYTNGINGSFDLYAKYTGYLPITSTDKANFLANTAIVPATSSALTLSQIMLQKYIALWGYGFEETWVDLRRYKYDPTVYTGYAPPASLFPDNSGKLVYRVRPRYNSEYIWNIEALKLIGGLDIDYHTKLTWFVNP